MKKILIPVDFSDASEQAITYTMNWTEKWEVEIQLVHVVYFPVPEHTIPSYGMYTPVTSTQAAQDELEKEARENMQQLVNDFRVRAKNRKHAIDIHGETLVGEPVKQVIDLVNDFRPDLMVIGVKQRNFLGRLLWGSSAPSLISQTPVPILTVPEDKKYEGIQEVAYASDFDPSDKEVFTRMYHFLAEDNPTFHCIHVVDQQDSIVINEQLDYMENMLKAHMEERGTQSDVKYDLLVSNDLVKAIEEYVERKNIDLVVLGTHKRKLLGKLLNPSHTKKLLLHISCPLLIFHM